MAALTLASPLTALAQPSQSNVGSGGYVCNLNDSVKTNKLWLTTGINYNISDTTRLPSAYGGNTGYTTVNHNVDSFWIVTKLSATYNPRSSAPLAYTGTYLNIGDNPYILSTAGNYLSGYWSIRDAAGNCYSPSSTDNGFNGWLSVYTEGGGQTVNAFDDINDGFRFDRCFALCHSDSLTFNLKLLADDVIDTVMVDNQYLYIVPMSIATSISEFGCSNQVMINKTIAVTEGRHFFRVWARDILHGHIGMNLWGSVSSTGNYLIKAKHDEKCSQTYTAHAVASEVPTNINTLANGVSVYPNPSSGNFSIETPAPCYVEVFDAYGKRLSAQALVKGTNRVSINGTPGVYFIKVYDGITINHTRVIVE